MKLKLKEPYAEVREWECECIRDGAGVRAIFNPYSGALDLLSSLRDPRPRYHQTVKTDGENWHLVAHRKFVADGITSPWEEA